MGEVTVAASTKNPVPRLPDKLSENKDSLDRGEDGTDCRRACHTLLIQELPG